MNEINDTIKYILDCLCNPKYPQDDVLDSSLTESAEFLKLLAVIEDIRILSSALCKGELHQFVNSRGFILSNLKALQSNLRHLTWQTKKIAEGDFTQRVDFLGEFSESFNIMTSKLNDLTNDLTRLANSDTLTKIPNRLALSGFLHSAFEDARQNNGKLCILLMDIDHFKAVNDTYGHDMGDKLLVELSAILTEHFRSSDFFCRYGGEEFMAVMPNTGVQIAQRRAGELLKIVEQAKFAYREGEYISATISIGVSELTPEDTDYNDVIKRSDEALYKAKNDGRNRFCVL